MAILNYNTFIHPEQVITATCSICQKIVAKEPYEDGDNPQRIREKMRKIKKCPYCGSEIDHK